MMAPMSWFYNLSLKVTLWALSAAFLDVQTEGGDPLASTPQTSKYLQECVFLQERNSSSLYCPLHTLSMYHRTGSYHVAYKIDQQQKIEH